MMKVGDLMQFIWDQLMSGKHHPIGVSLKCQCELTSSLGDWQRKASSIKGNPREAPCMGCFNSSSNRTTSSSQKNRTTSLLH